MTEKKYTVICRINEDDWIQVGEEYATLEEALEKCDSYEYSYTGIVEEYIEEK